MQPKHVYFSTCFVCEFTTNALQLFRVGPTQRPAMILHYYSLSQLTFLFKFRLMIFTFVQTVAFLSVLIVAVWRGLSVGVCPLSSHRCWAQSEKEVPGPPFVAAKGKHTFGCGLKKILSQDRNANRAYLQYIKKKYNVCFCGIRGKYNEHFFVISSF